MNSTVTLYVVRHGRTILNTLDRVQGWCDSFLTKEGIEVAKYLGKGLRKVEFDAVYTSDLRRTLQTAQVVLSEQGQTGLPINELEGLRESCFGSFEGKLNNEMWNDIALYLHYKSHKALLQAFLDGEISCKQMLDSVAEIETSGEAEDFNTVESRTQKALKQIVECESKEGKNTNVLIICHGMSILAMLENLGGKELVKGHVENVSVSKVVFSENKFVVKTMGDMSYVHAGKELSK